MTRLRSLADELADLVNPIPQAELDPEAASLADGDQLLGSDDELAGLVAGAAAARRAIATDIAIVGAEYAGRRSSRAALFGDGDDPEGVSSSDEGASDDADGVEQEDQAAANAGVGYAMHEHAPLPPGRRDLSSVPTMFVNGHMNGPGRDDTTSSSSSLINDDADSSAGEESQPDGRGNTSTPAAVGARGAVLLQHDQSVAVAPQGSAGRQYMHAGESSDAQASEHGMSDHQDNQQQQGPGGSGTSSSSSEAEVASDSGASNVEQQQQQQDVMFAAPSTAGLPSTADAAAAAVAHMLGDDKEMQQLEREAAAVHAEAAQQLVAASARNSRDDEKAAGVRAQQRLWGAALELRIRLQKALNGANVLPRPAARSLMLAADKQVAERYMELLGSCRQTLQDLLHLHHTLAQQHPAAAAALAAMEPQQQQQQQQHLTGKRSRSAADLDADAGPAARDGVVSRYVGSSCSADDAWTAVDSAINSLAGFRDASVDKWHRRTVLASGTAALRGSSGLRALQQGVSSQVAALMGDRAKLISRSQLPVQLAPRPLGQPAAAGAHDAEHMVAAAPAASERDRERDPETYDEGDFYQQLLKELIDSAPPGSLPQHLAGARPAKRRKVVDRRASKGRKIRYHTLEKLVGFMAPAELVQPPFAEQLFGNLFSHAG